MKYDYLIVGAGFFGSICAYELNKRGKNVCVIDKRNHIGGNVYTEKKDDIHIHKYGPHIFHTDSKRVWNWINQFCTFNNFSFQPVATLDGKMYSLPFNMWTMSQVYGITSPQTLDNIGLGNGNGNTYKSVEDFAIAKVGREVYEILIKGYTTKQWGRDPKYLPASIIKRLPIRRTYDNRYFNDKYQGIPIGGYTQIFKKLLKGIDVYKEFDYLEDIDLLPEYDELIYTGPIDEFYHWEHGKLEYRSLKWEEEVLDIDNYQGTAMMNYLDVDVPYTRIIEHKHFDYKKSDKTIISREYPQSKGDPYYPICDTKNMDRYKKYKKMPKIDRRYKPVHFGGRLAEYKYYDMHQVIGSALSFVKKL